MAKKKHIILGASGIIGRTLATALETRGADLRLVDRHPSSGPGDRVVADLLDPEQVKRALKDADVVHFAVGLPYEDRVWQEQFPPIVQNVLAALHGTTTRLVFLDNVYMYGSVDGAMTESTPFAATSKKGVVRRGLVDAIAKSNIDWVIARSADFYGPGASTTSLLNMFVLANVAADKPPAWLGSVDFAHSFTFTHDIAAAMAVLADADHVSRTTWHVPTAPPTTVRALAALAGDALGVTVQEPQVLDRATVDKLGASDPVMGAVSEMFYQYDRPFVLDSSRYEKRFDARPTPYAEGISASLAR